MTKAHLKRVGIIILVLAAFIPIIPLLVLGQDSVIAYIDNLDSDLVWFKITAESGKWVSFSNGETIDQVMNGIPRNSMVPAFNFITLLFYVFPPFIAYVFNYALIRIIGFVGMFLLMRDYILKRDIFLQLGVSVAFVFLPFWGMHSGTGVTGLPLITWCYLNIIQGNYRFRDFLIIFILSFYSSLLFTGIFYLILLSLFFIYNVYRLKAINRPFFFAMLLNSFGFILAELNLFVQFFSHEYISHRVERFDEGFGLLGSLERAFNLFFHGHFHAPFFVFPMIIGVTSFVLTLIILNVIRKEEISNSRLFITLFLIIVLISLFYGSWSYQPVKDFSRGHALLKIIQWDRFHWLLPLFWYALFGLSLAIIKKQFKSKITGSVLVLIVLAQVVISYANNTELKMNFDKMLSGREIKDKPSFRQFYSEDLYRKVDSHINKSKNSYRIISVGIFPEIAVYNGFYSLDSYQRNYPVSYKHEFRKVIEGELDKNELLKNYFDDWGSRCYAFSSELEKTYLWPKNSNKIINRLDFDYEQLKSMGCEYVLSALPLNSDMHPELKFEEHFVSAESCFDIYLYQII